MLGLNKVDTLYIPCDCPICGTRYLSGDKGRSPDTPPRQQCGTCKTEIKVKKKAVRLALKEL